MDKNKIQVKDLISIGIFIAIYFVVSMICIIATGININIYLWGNALVALITGPIIMLYFAKVGKKFSIIILSTIITLIVAFMTGPTLYSIGIGIIAGIVAELIANNGKYKSFVKNMIAFTIMSLWPFGVYIALYINWDNQYARIVKDYGLEQTSMLRQVMNPTGMFIAFLGALVAGVIGAYFGKALLKKHFKKAGIV